MTVRITSSAWVSQVEGAGKALARSCAVVSQTVLRGIPKSSMLEVASTA